MAPKAYRSVHVLVALLPLILSGCSAGGTTSAPSPTPTATSVSPTPAAPAVQPPLAGTSWQLVSIASMDDAQGTTEVPDPSTFTVSLQADGTATFQIDCNRGNGSWSATPSDDPASGAIEFGPIAVTRMMCPQPSLDQRVSTALGDVRGYLIKDRQLHMSLMADAGILTWNQT